MALYTTEDEYVVAIAETQLAISRAANIGHVHINRSGGGAERSTTEESLTNLRKHLARLQYEYSELKAENEGVRNSSRFSPGW